MNVLKQETRDEQQTERAIRAITIETPVNFADTTPIPKNIASVGYLPA